jgi:hypothetical protein
MDAFSKKIANHKLTQLYVHAAPHASHTSTIHVPGAPVDVVAWASPGSVNKSTTTGRVVSSSAIVWYRGVVARGFQIQDQTYVDVLGHHAPAGASCPMMTTSD